MTKNISVIDMQGNVYEATYPKRAKGLVKKGRARFVNESTICLACPPYQMEDNKMDINENEINKILDTTIQGLQNGDKEGNQDRVLRWYKEMQGQQQEDKKEKSQYLSEILQSIGAIIQNTAYLEAAFGQLENVMDSDEALDGIRGIVSAREVTNQKAIEILGKLAEKLIS